MSFFKKIYTKIKIYRKNKKIRYLKYCELAKNKELRGFFGWKFNKLTPEERKLVYKFDGGEWWDE